MQIPVESEAGAVQGGRAIEKEPQPIAGTDPFEAPDEIGDDVFEEMFLQSQGDIPWDAEGEEELHPDEQAQDAASEVDLGEDAPVEPPTVVDPRVDQLQGALSAIQAQLAAMQQKNTHPETQTSKPVNVADRVKELMPKAAPGVADQFAQVIETVADAKYGSQLEQLTQAVTQLAGEVNQGKAREHSNTFQSKLVDLMDRNKVTNEQQREDIVDSVLGRGWQKYGNSFDIGHVPLLFKEVLTNHRRFGFSKTEGIIDEKEQDMRDNPPVKTSQAGGTGIEGVKSKLANASDASMDFHGENFSKLVGNFLGATEKFTGKTLGRRRR